MFMNVRNIQIVIAECSRPLINSELLILGPLRNDNTSAQWKRLAATVMMFPTGCSQV